MGKKETNNLSYRMFFWNRFFLLLGFIWPGQDYGGNEG